MTDNNKLILKNCPFCGCKPKTWKQGIVRFKLVSCSSDDCGAYFTKFTPQEWNNRAVDLQPPWQPIENAPKYEKLFICRNKNKPHVTFEAMFFRDIESWEMPKEYDYFQNMTIDEPICDNWEDYEWSEIPKIT